MINHFNFVIQVPIFFMQPLAFLKPGSNAQVIDIVLSKPIKDRLLGFGLCEGAVLTMITRGNGPVQIQVAQTRLAIGFDEAMGVYVGEEGR